MSTSYCRTGEKKSYFGIYERIPFAYNGRIPNDSRTTKTIYRKNMEKEKCKNITTIKKITSGVTAMVAMAAGIVMIPFIANASSENIQNSFGGV